MRRLFYPILILLLMVGSVFLLSDADAQCVMCKAVAEKGKEDGEEMAKGLNAGILYLMAIPYTLILTLVTVFFRKRIANFFRELKKA